MEKDTILYVLTKSKEYLQSKGIETARLDAEVLLAHELKVQRIKLYSNFDRKLTEEEKDAYRALIKERGNFRPVAYMIGRKGFYKHEFTVNENVLIPRPETEELVEFVLNCEEKDDALRILDMGTGSGCIGITLVDECPKWVIHFSDISAEAVKIAEQNYSAIVKKNTHKAPPQFYLSDLFDSIPKENKYNFITFNSPYIPLEEKDRLMSDVLDHEPHLALFIINPEEFYKKLVSQTKDRLEKSGSLYLETDPQWISLLQTISDSEGFQMTVKKDLSKKDRFVRLKIK